MSDNPNQSPEPAVTPSTPSTPSEQPAQPLQPAQPHEINWPPSTTPGEVNKSLHGSDGRQT
jgi:hypothetical protein